MTIPWSSRELLEKPPDFAIEVEALENHPSVQGIFQFGLHPKPQTKPINKTDIDRLLMILLATPNLSTRIDPVREAR